ncbi:LacI family DNA-binding transcriptional regulator [Victivallis sp. Marseille-Q1083]|uniref:LacI family DNA-binding transcriptional regulator n=1 Tax=Victivallis sp. Marseille-Q1083 TaxID=2717288 RepID=UPI00158A7CCC|nr:substrate-binding domain-containing protein [Victivallis sp. Marseille-Q1083]
MKNDQYFNPLLDQPELRQPTSADALYRHLTGQLRRNRAALSGKALLPERQLALYAGLDRSLIHKAYQRLLDDGLLERPEGSRRYLLTPPSRETEPGKVLGVVLPMPYSEYVNIKASQYIRSSFFNGIIDRASELDYAVRMLQLPEPDADAGEIDPQLRRLAGEIRGIVHLGDRGYDEDPVLEKLLELDKIPQVFLAAEHSSPALGAIRYDYPRWLKLFTQYLRELGHRRLAIIQPDYWRRHMYCYYDFGDIRDCLPDLRNAGIEIHDDWIITFNDYHMAEKLADKIARLIQLPQQPTLLLCNNDVTALETMRILQDCGKKIPRDFSVVGFGDLPESRESEPPLTTFRLPFYEAGRGAVDLLLDHRANGCSEQNHRKYHPVNLITRSSVGRPNPALTIALH